MFLFILEELTWWIHSIFQAASFTETQTLNTFCGMNQQSVIIRQHVVCFHFFYQMMWITLSRPSTSQLSTKNVYLYCRWCLVLVLIFLFCFRPKTNLECYNWDVFLSLSSKDGGKYQKGPKLLSLKLQINSLAGFQKLNY